LARFPNFAKATLWQTLLEPGDVLYFPRTWWHDFRSLEPSISLNHFTGEKASLGELARVATAGGVGHWARLAKDFVWHGLLGQKFERRLFSEEPSGLFFYKLVKDGLRQRLRGRG
jgi:lysine-specific demethylase 8